MSASPLVKSVLAASAVAAVAAAAGAARALDTGAPPSRCRSLTRWGLRHGLTGALMRVGARGGDQFARLSCAPALQADPYALYDEIRAAGTVAPGKVVMPTARHAVVCELIRAEEFRSGWPDETLPRSLRTLLAWAQEDTALGPIEAPSMVMSNGADHARYRRLVSKAFTPRAVEGLGERVTAIATGLLDDLERDHPDGRADLVAAYTSRLPVLMIADILAVPADRVETFIGWGRDIALLADLGIGYRTFARAEAAVREMDAWLRGHFAEIRRAPGDDLLSRIIVSADAEAHSGGPGLDDYELGAVAGLLLFAGFETTVHLLGNGTVLLTSHPDQLAGLRADPTGWRNAVEEILRFESPVQNGARWPVRDTVLAGVPVPRGMFVAPMWGAANRDPEVFPEPDRFDVQRPNAREHLAFAAGGHFCVGAGLARLEGEIGLRLLFERFGDLALAGPPQRRQARNLRGYQSIPVALNAGALAEPPAAAVPVAERFAAARRRAQQGAQKYQGKADQSGGRFSRKESRPSTASSVM